LSAGEQGGGDVCGVDWVDKFDRRRASTRIPATSAVGASTCTPARRSSRGIPYHDRPAVSSSSAPRRASRWCRWGRGRTW